MTESSSPGRRLRIGTRGSKLARWQAEWVATRLTALGHSVEIVEIATRGDLDREDTLANIGAPGVFTKEIQRAVLARDVDVAVHSLKDLPTDAVEGLILASVPVRESVSDVLVTNVAGDLDSLPQGARVGTGSLRRRAQLLHARPDLQMADVRGNVDTRLRKLDAGEYDALVLAEAGLRRLGFIDRITQLLPFSVMLPAVGQGALAIECRAEDEATRQIVERLDDVVSHAAITAERALLAALAGGCLAPIGAWGRTEAGELRLSAVVSSADGKQRLAAEDTGHFDDAAALGRRVAKRLLDGGAATLIAASRAR